MRLVVVSAVHALADKKLTAEQASAMQPLSDEQLHQVANVLEAVRQHVDKSLTVQGAPQMFIQWGDVQPVAMATAMTLLDRAGWIVQTSQAEVKRKKFWAITLAPKFESLVKAGLVPDIVTDAETRIEALLLAQHGQLQ